MLIIMSCSFKTSRNACGCDSPQAGVNSSMLDVNCCVQGLPQFDCPDGEQASESIVYRLFKVLFASKISLGGEYRRVSK